MFAGWFIFAAPVRAQVFVNTNPMMAPRTDHIATLLEDGRVLLTGGGNAATGNDGESSAEIYDPPSGTFSSTAGGMTTGRNEHAAARLLDGRVLVTGGHFASGFTAEIYNPATGTFSATGNLNAHRVRHTATLLPDGKVLITGGSSDATENSSAEIFDPATGLFTFTAGSMATGRSYHTATLIDGKVMVTGGNTDGGTSLASAEIYDPATGLFSTTGSMATARVSHTATRLADGRVIVAGGQIYPDPGGLESAEIYDPDTGVFSVTLGNLTATRYYHTATLLSDGKVLIAGGLGDDASVTAELYDPLTETFSVTGPLQTALRNHEAVLLPSGAVLVTGGGADGGGSTESEVFVPAGTGLTPVGLGVKVLPIDISTGANPVAMMFASIEQSGTTTVSVSDIGPEAPAGFSAGSPARYYDLATTAIFSGEIVVCISYTGVTFDTTPSLFHFENGEWLDRTVQVDAINRIVCGNVTSLSPFALLKPAVYTAAVQPPIDANGSSVFAQRGSIPVRFTLAADSVTTCQLPLASLTLARVSGQTVDLVNENDYLMPSDTGSWFRVAGCQYLYNLNGRALGTGSYRVEIRIGEVSIGAAVFGIK